MRRDRATANNDGKRIPECKSRLKMGEAYATNVSLVPNNFPNYTFADKPTRRKLLSSMIKFYGKLNLKLFAAIRKIAT